MKYIRERERCGEALLMYMAFPSAKRALTTGHPSIYRGLIVHAWQREVAQWFFQTVSSQVT
jgi:hypothetical protein